MRRYNERVQDVISKLYSDGLRYLVGYYYRVDDGKDSYALLAAFDKLADADCFIENYDRVRKLEILNNYDE